LASDQDTIVVRGITFEANHGVYPGERQKRRNFYVDVELRTSLARSSQSDKVADTVNYEDICSLVVQAGTARTYHLLEAVCGAMLTALAERFPTASITCELTKPTPPCEGHPASASVRMTRGPSSSSPP
jgi:dihydroneopterin aldolase